MYRPIKRHKTKRTRPSGQRAKRFCNQWQNLQPANRSRQNSARPGAICLFPRRGATWARLCRRRARPMAGRRAILPASPAAESERSGRQKRIGFRAAAPPLIFQVAHTARRLPETHPKERPHEHTRHHRRHVTRKYRRLLHSNQPPHQPAKRRQPQRAHPACQR